MSPAPRTFVAAATFLAAAMAMAAPAAAAPAAAATPASAGKQRPPETYLEYLYGMPEALDLEALVGKPDVVGTFNYVFTDPVSGERRLGGYAEVVAVYDIPVEELLTVATDFEGYPSFMPRMLGVEVLSRDGQVVRARYRVGIKFMGIEVAYDSISDTAIERLPGGAAATRSWMVESLDGAAYESFNSFYFCPATVRGKTMTFVRFFSRPGVCRPSAGMLQLLNLFAAPEAKGQVAAVAKEAQKRAKKRAQ
jgi:hypothetical protein